MFLHSLLISSLVIFFFVSFFFCLSLLLKKNAVADIAWGLGFIVITFTTLFLNNGGSTKQLLVTLLVVLWGARLATYIYFRNRGKSEDFRYKQWKEQWGSNWKIKSYLYVFLLQGALMILVATPIIFVNTYAHGTIGFLGRAGVTLWLIGFYFETLGDWQLFQFKKNPNNKGKVMSNGLWRYTRHPNYFGESMMWWGIYVIALSDMNAWWTFIGPLFITYSLLRVSGVTLLEKKYKGNKEYREYQRNTSSFIPWFPKK